MTTLASATQVNLFHDAIDLASFEGNKMHQKATIGLSET